MMTSVFSFFLLIICFYFYPLVSLTFSSLAFGCHLVVYFSDGAVFLFVFGSVGPFVGP